MMGCRIAKGLFTAVAIFAIPRNADACHQVTVCVDFLLSAHDIGVGDLPQATLLLFPSDKGLSSVPARGVRVTLVPPPPEFPYQTFLDEETGCFTFSTQFASGHKLFVHPEAFLSDDPEDPDDEVIRIAGFAGCADVLQEMLSNPYEPAPLQGPRKVHLHNLVDGAQAHPYIQELTPLFRVFAWAVWIVGRFEDELAPGLEGEHRMLLHAEPVDQLPASCALAGNLGAFGGPEQVYFRPEVTTKRFVIGHEIGHWVQSNWTGNNYSGSYQWTGLDDDCKFAAVGSNSLHGLRSAERGDEGMGEGFAHFFASWIFDDDEDPDARFKYYKAIDLEEVPSYTDLVETDDYEVSLAGAEVCDNAQPPNCHVVGGTTAWVENMCPADWATPIEPDIASEIDWMRFFWQFSSAEFASPAPVASMRVILDALDATNQGSPDWPALRSALDSNYHGRFDDLSEANGVYDDIP